MFIFTLQSSQLSVCVYLRSTDLVMNNLFHAGNTFCETQQSSVETLQSTDWGVLNYNSCTLWSSNRNTALTPPPLPHPFSKDVTFICASQPRHKDTNRAFFSISERRSEETCWISSANMLNRTSTSWLVTTVCCVCCSCTAQSTATT